MTAPDDQSTSSAHAADVERATRAREARRKRRRHPRWFPSGAAIVLVIAATSLWFGRGCGRANTAPLPIDVSMRQSSLFRSDGVLQIRNRSSETLNLGIFLTNLDTRQQKDFRAPPLPPAQTIELGIEQLGCTLEPNEDILITDLPAGMSNRRMLNFRTFRTSEGKIGIRLQ
jgi:hypothetical protein